MISFPCYMRDDGSAGIRNYTAIIPASVCAAPLALKAAFRVDGVVGLSHKGGCCQIGNDYKRTTWILRKLCTHPNVGGVVLVALGCEGTPWESIAEEIEKSGRPVELIHIQRAGGSKKAMEKAVQAAEGIKERTAKTAVIRERGIKDLTVGLECGGSDATSGLSANPVIGRAADELVRQGAKVILSETTELIGAEHAIMANTGAPRIKQKIIDAVKRVENEFLKAGEDIRGTQPTPGNIEGGLSTLEEKSLGCVYKAGTNPFVDFLEYGEPARKSGLSFMDTPGQDVESMTGMAAGGANLFLFSTGRGSPVGFPLVPTVKITGNEATYTRMIDDIDFDSSGIFRGKPLDELGQELFDLILQVSRGKQTKSELNEYYEMGIPKREITL
ncbi:MAG: UxaA family hydrolase [Spirochaetia bacterium]